MPSSVETRRVPDAWNATRTDYPRDTPIHKLFEEQAAGSPDSVAVLFEGQELTYGQLNEGANRVAQRLRRLGVGRGTLVGLCVERSPELLTGLLGILKAGGAYVPLDPGYPDERLGFMLEETGVPVIVAHRPTEGRLAQLRHRAAVLGADLDAGAVAGEDTADPSGGATADDLAYVMYTSGSTGRPKGVMVGHRAVVRLVRDTNYCRFNRDEVFLQLAPISFDASTFEIWGALLNGARLAVMHPRPPALDELGAAIRRHGVTTLWLTSGLFNLMVDQRAGDLRPLRQLLAGGDVLSPPHVRRALDAMEDGAVINGYGPTESTTFACCYPMMKGYRVGSTVPIGRPISNTTVRLLDEGLRPVPLGEPGELYIGGDGLAFGYLHRPGLTGEKFIPDPFGDEHGARLYRTGDLARFRPDGNLEFLGRLDSQVKIMGHRIEPGEVEAALVEHPGVRQAAVAAVAGPGGGKRLVAYVVAAGPVGTDAGELRTYLSNRLPPYLIPSEFIHLEDLPLSPNGKVDRSSLPTPGRHEARADVAARPGAGLQEEITALLGQILGRDVGPDDNFFDLGASSLLLIEFHSELQKRHPCDLPLTALFDHPTVRSLAGRLAGAAVEPGFQQVQDRARKQQEALSRRKQMRKVR